MAKTAEVRDGAEVSVETGLGNVTKVDAPKGRNAHVTIEASHLQKPVMGWVDTANLKLYNRVIEAAEQGYRVGYTIVVHRKRDQPKDVPLAEIPTTQRVRDLEEVVKVAGEVGAKPPAQDDATPAQEAAPAPAAPPAPTNTPAPASGPTCGLCGGSLTDGLPVRRVSGVMQHVECPPASGSGPLKAGDETGSAPAPVDEFEVGDADPGAGPIDPSPVDPPDESQPGADDASPPPAATDVPASAPPRPRIAEGRPWDYTNSDGSLNLGSYAVTAAEGVVLLAQEQLLERARRTEGPFVPPSIGQINGLARRLLKAADIAQASFREDGHVVRMAGSHGRARSAVRASLHVYPVPTGATADELDTWVENLALRAAQLLRLTVDLVDPAALT